LLLFFNLRTSAQLLIPLREKDSLRRLKTIDKSILNQHRSSMPIVTSWIAPVAACLPSIVVLPFAKMVARNEHQSSMANFPGPSNCMEIFGDCVLKDMMWQSCVVARTKCSLTKKHIFEFKIRCRPQI
jgi:hypothetical protein